ncbi:uncharacterized protein LOC142311202 [Anomaloglossus baeobatrachus]|uniref:uncharacterized protein LOC142311202 n=1 Tax=Anomaloglossus baeobatrachus TaxID=238106 RepID=UPI003F50D110
METILQATMEIICLLIGQENVTVKKCGNAIFIEPPPRSLQKNDRQKILDLANKIIELLTVERLLDVKTEVCNDIPQRDYQAGCSSHAYPDMASMFQKPSSEHLGEAIREKEQKSSGDITELLGSCEKGNLQYGDMDRSVQHSSICDQIKAELNNEDKISAKCRLEELSVLNIKEESFSGDEDPFTEAVISTPESLYTAIDIKEESLSSEETEYTTNDLKKESSLNAEGNLGEVSSTPFHIVKVLTTSIHKKASRKLNTSQIVQPNTDGMHCCQDCRKCDRTNSSSIKHQKGHRVKKIPCPQCGKNFYCNSALTCHQAAHAEEKMFACFECGKNMPSKPALLVHQRMHKGKSYIFGPQINHPGEKSCSSKPSIVLQQRNHTGNALYSCSECGKCFLQKTCLQQHFSTHSGEKPYACSECGKRFIQKSSLKQHLNVHLPKKKETFCCSECGKCYKLRANFRWHMLIHLGEK